MTNHINLDQTSKENLDFQLGLTMSGAISAGAYTAGVFDFLIQALDEWEKAKNGQGADKADVPTHRVGIKVISGASAGAITAAIGAIALADGDQKPQRFATCEANKQTIKYYLPKLYETWVVKPTLVAKNADTLDFLTTSDLTGPPVDDFSHSSGCLDGLSPASTAPQPVVSLLNARLLDQIAQDALAVETLSAPRCYIAQTLHIYMTLSNLRGIPYTVKFEGGDYEMVSHGDRVHYAVTGLGSWNSISSFGERDQKREIDPSGLTANCPKWRDFSIFALASAAFPVGLAPRTLSATPGSKIGPDGYAEEYNGRLFPFDTLASRTNSILPSFSPALLEKPSFTFRTADGGIIDNDPFEYARFCLKNEEEFKTGIQDTDRLQPKQVDHAVIMISPFPASAPLAAEDQPAPDILSIFSALLPSLIDQVRFKPSELVLAADKNYLSRYLIGPKRTVQNQKEKKNSRYPIASGLLSGFGGFVAQSFLEHDFQLGRRNCQWFLQTSFALPADNQIIEHGFKKIDKKKFRAKNTNTGELTEDIVILPLFGTAADEIPLPDWPKISNDDFKILQDRVASRFDAVAAVFLAANIKDNLLWLLLRIALVAQPWLPQPFGIIREKALAYVRLTMLADLVRRDQIKGWNFGAPPEELDPDDIRLVLGELLNPAYDLRNVAGLAKTTNLEIQIVKKIILFLQAAGTGGAQPFEIWEAPGNGKMKSELYTIVSRKPGWLRETFWTLLGGRFLPTFTQPRTDAP